MKVAVEGCCHGDLDATYSEIARLEQQNGYKVDLLLICGDFQAIRNHQDLQCMAVPNKFKKLGGFYRYYIGEKQAPILTLVIGGNHEASNYMWELYHGGWLAPNIYFLGFAGCVRVNGVRIAGLSGIYNKRHYKQGHFEHIPYDRDTMRSIYHVREYDTFRLSQLTSPDIVMSHDWPLGVTRFGDERDLVRRKPFFEAEIQTNTLGSPPAMDLLKCLKPAWWFSAHLHCRFEAKVIHGVAPQSSKFQPHAQDPPKMENPDEIIIDDFDEELEDISMDVKAPSTSTDTDSTVKIRESDSNPDEIVLEDEIDNVAQPLPVASETKFLALDKCLPRRQFLEVIEVPSEDSPDIPKFEFDPEWLAIVRAFHPYLSTTHLQPSLPDAAQAADSLKKASDWVKQNVGDKSILGCQTFWMTAPGPEDPGREGPNRFRQPNWFTNPQTEAFCNMLGLDNKINPKPKEFGHMFTAS